jgi:uncharacterized Zn-binding protein involved in type VI secretion
MGLFLTLNRVRQRIDLSEQKDLKPREYEETHMPPAARITDMHVCPMVTGIVPHVGGPILPPGCPTVLIGGLPAARITDMATCVGPPDVIIMGSPTVLVGNLMAARIGDPTAHGGVIVLGCFTVIIGEAGAPAPSAPVVPPVPSTPPPPGTGGPSKDELKAEIEKDLKDLRAKELRTGDPDQAGREKVTKKLMNVVEKLDLTTPKDSAIFYSGDGMSDAATALAKAKGLSTIESPPDGAWLNELRLGNDDVLGRKSARQVWSRASERYAESASGEVKVLLNNPKPDSIFLTKELPALAKNSSVTRIVYVPPSG